MSVLVITPSTGAPELEQAIKSVASQDIQVDHLIVCDGKQFRNKVEHIVDKICEGSGAEACYLPYNTGGGGFYGHRIMAGFSHLINHDHVLFLDQDNYFDYNHVSSLVSLIEKNNLDWAYSLRTIINKEGLYQCKDNCESLGKWPAWVNPNAHLIDSSSYCFKTEFFRKVGHVWDFGWGADRRFYILLRDHFKHENYDCTGKHSLFYRLGGNEGSVTKEFFEQGNQRMLLQYKTEKNYPWLKQSS